MQAVFFDLDGTLLDTAPDLADACNYVLNQYQRPPIPLSQFREWVHGGAMLMLCESFGITSEHADYQAIRGAFLQNYQQRLANKTQLFPGINQVLLYLESSQIPWGIITNKHAWLVQPLLDYFQLTARCCCVISGDTLPTAKPHPAPLLHACALVPAQPQQCIYVGDTLGDIQAAQAAGMPSIAVSYGYNPKHCDISTWRADAIAANAEELLAILRDWNSGLI
jgi:N-acetyl-D-muramate 6-phosphate phosphatase